MSKIVGIDLGTTNSVVSVMESGSPVVINTSEGSRTLPSVIGYKSNGEKLVGVIAKRQSVTNPKNTISSIKRFMGHSFSEVESEAKNVSYEVKKDKKGMATVHVPAINKNLTPEEISAMILQKLKADAESYLGEPVTKAVITVPAYFNDSQRKATKDAGEIAGLEVLRIINEPTAAALAYGLDKKANETIMVFDLGGGTFDVSILDVGDGAFEVLATNGDSHLGGDDFDYVIVKWLISEFKKDNGVDLSQDNTALQRLKEAAEKAKIELSSQLTTNINLPYITAQDGNPKHLDLSLSRSTYEQLCSELIDRIKKPVNTAIKDSGKSYQNIDEVILVGGSSRIPMVQSLVKNITGKDPNQSVNPDEAVALGAAVQGGILAGDVKDIVLIDVTPLSLGVEVNGGMMDVLIEKNSAIPTKRQRVYTTAVDNQPEVEVHIMQGERPLARDNKSLGRFSLTGIVPAPARVPQIELQLDIDANGILNVSAKDLGTGKSQSITITGSGSLSADEIERMVKEAEENAENDKIAKEKIELKNKCETLIFSIERTLKDDDEKNDIESQTKDDIKLKIQELKSALQDDDTEKINSAYDSLEKCSHEIALKMYEKYKQENPQVEPEVVDIPGV